MRCLTVGCPQIPEARFTWPGRNEALACFGCSSRALTVANTIGLHLQVLPLTLEQTAVLLPLMHAGHYPPPFCPHCDQPTKKASLDAEGKWTWDCSEGCNP